MAEHLHGYPRCETPVGTACGSSDLHFEECKSHGALRSCEGSVVDGIPTGQYRCMHDEAPAKATPKKAAKAKAKAKAKPKKKAPARKAKAKAKAKKASRKPAKSSRRGARPKAKAGRAKKGGARKKK